MRALPMSPTLLALGLAAAGLTARCGGADLGGEATASAALSAPEATRPPSPCASVPSALAVPAGNELEFSLSADGVQIYDCKDTASGPAWVFRAPQATLYDRQGDFAGTHYAGPTWESKDGSKVVGSRIAGVTVDPTAIPWLLLGATSHSGDGRMEEVTYVQRVATSGGIAPPAADCTAFAVGTTQSVHYTATYCFSEAD